MGALPHPHCPWCGHRFPEDQPWPRACGHCARVSYLNPLPVGVLLVPVHSAKGDGLLAVRRGIAPGYGELALPGGFIEGTEPWQVASARELYEETGVVVAPDALRLFRAMSDGDYLLIFSVAPALTLAQLPPFEADTETLERVILTAPETLAFPLHTRGVELWFTERQRGTLPLS